MAYGIINVADVNEFTMDGYPGQYLRNIVVKDDGAGFGLHYVRLTPGSSLPEHEHDGVEVCYMLSGKADAVMDGKTQEVGPDVAVVVPKGVKHYLVNTGEGDLVLLAFFCPPLL